MQEERGRMRKFSSYGPINTKLHYYVPRQTLVDQAITHLIGETPDEGGHYSTMWAPRQRGKSWILQQALSQLRADPRYIGFDVLKINLDHADQYLDASGTACQKYVASLRNVCPEKSYLAL